MDEIMVGLWLGMEISFLFVNGILQEGCAVSQSCLTQPQNHPEAVCCRCIGKEAVLELGICVRLLPLAGDTSLEQHIGELSTFLFAYFCKRGAEEILCSCSGRT